MMNRNVWRAVQSGILVLVFGIGVFADEGNHHSTNLSGIINDHTSVAAGSWEVHGVWSMKLKGDSGKADFSAVLTMERSDYWAFITPGANPDARTAHTHHITLVDGAVTPIANGFEVSGMAAFTGNGNPAPFGQYAPVLIDITGGTSVTFSNIKLILQGAAAGHFGSLPLAGAVRRSTDAGGH